MLRESINNFSLGNSSADSNELIVDSVRRLLQAFSQLVFLEQSHVEDSTVIDDSFPEHYLRVDLRQPMPYRCIKIFLIAIENIAQALDIQMISRKYRLAFTRNYRSLMPADKRLYRVDVLEAGQESHTLLWVNGDKYYLSEQVLKDNQKFRTCWFQLLELIRDVQKQLQNGINQKTECRHCSLKKILLQSAQIPDSMCQYCEINWKSRLGSQLICFDVCWTRFERSYINALIDIERKSRSPIMKCIYIEEELRQYEALYNSVHERLYPSIGNIEQNILIEKDFCHPMDEIQRNYILNQHIATNKKIRLCCNNDESHVYTISKKDDEKELHKISIKINILYEKLIKATAYLNGIANVKRKGRTDFDYIVLKNAILLLTEYHLKNYENQPSFTSWSSNEYNFCVKYNWIHCTHPQRDWLQSMTLNEMRSLFPLAKPLLEEMESLRNYFSALSLNPERIDPHLAQNIPLVNALANFEAHWDDARLYLEKHTIAQSLTQFISFLSEIVDLDLNMFRLKKQDERMINDLIEEFGQDNSIQFDNNDKDNLDYTDEANTTFEELIDSCDVGIFLTFPRLVTLFYASNPFPDSYQSCLLRNLLPDTFQLLTINNSTNPSFCNEFQSVCHFLQSSLVKNNNYQCKLSLPLQDDMAMDVNTKCHIFQLHRFVVSHPLWPKIIPELFQNIIYSGSSICQFCEIAKQNHNITSNALEFSIVLNLLESCLKSYNTRQNDTWTGKTRLPPIDGLKKQVDTFLKALEECSILLQRTKPKEWNEFLKVVIKSLQAYRENSKNSTSFESSDSMFTPLNSQRTCVTASTEINNSKLDWLLEGSPITTRFSSREKLF